ncbi:MAG TPA: hypothetical protein VMD59_11615 [Acidimicrobiales bacterium]|nr:hypothetical protein [Acidimicrobiales bacterium]
MLTAALNCSEGRDSGILEKLASAAGDALLDLHADPWHHRCVLTLGGPATEEAARHVAAAAVAAIDLRAHAGVHPRIGVVDVVPFTPYPPFVRPARAPGGAAGSGSPPGGATPAGSPEPPGGAIPPGRAAGALEPAPLGEALRARDDFAAWASSELGLPCFLYGPGRSLPELRREAFRALVPDCGPAVADPATGACCIGAREPLVAYNLVLAAGELARERQIAAAIRSPAIRALGLRTGTEIQVSCNLLRPLEIGPAEAYDLVAGFAAVERAELVGLIPAAALERIPVRRWPELDVGIDRTLERRLAAAPGTSRSRGFLPGETS